MRIGSFQHPSRSVVAPMAGVTDLPFRNLCRATGTYWLVSEMITSDQRLWNTTKSRNRLRFKTELEPRWIQIAGAEPDMLAKAARENVALGAQIIDINMGCPAKKVCSKAAGSALMRDERLVEQILNAVVAAVDVPVTLKMRLGWSKNEKNAINIARIAEQSGVQLLAVHGRTRQCKFEGIADYDAIGEVVCAVDIPVVANGDIDSPRKAAWVIEQTGAAAIMVGRAAQGRPWLPDQIDHYLQTGKLKKDPCLSEVKDLLVTHINKLAEFYGEVMGPRIARKHVAWYLSAIPGDWSVSEIIRKFNGLNQVSAQIEVIEEVFDSLRKNKLMVA